MNNEENEFNPYKLLKDVTDEDITNGLYFEDSLVNVLKWYLIGAYITNDKVQTEKIEHLFTEKGGFPKKRPYKTEAKYVYNALMSGEIVVHDKDKKPLTISDIAHSKAHEIAESVGTLYKNRPKDPEADQKKRDKKIAKYAINSENFDTSGIKSPDVILNMAKSQNALLANVASTLLQQAEKQMQIEEEEEALKNKEIPVYGENPEQFMFLLQHMLTELYSADNAEFHIQDVESHILNLQNNRVGQLVKAA